MLGPDAGGLSASTVARLTEVWADEHAHWLKRDLSARHYVYFWADGIHVQARLEDDAQCLLVIIGATPEGKKELVGLIDGVRESAQSWRELLLDLKRRGLAVAPELAIADGALGFWKAIEEVWPRTRSQRCWVHKTANVLNKLPKSQPIPPSAVSTCSLYPMDWTPPPDGIESCQGGRWHQCHEKGKRHPWIRLASSGSIWRSTASKCMVRGQTDPSHSAKS